MATVRLFANLREAAGTGSIELDGATVGEVLDDAAQRFGDVFAAGVGAAHVWVNGVQAERATPVTHTDEIALIPPVSGGATTLVSSAASPAVLVIVLGITLALANADSVQTLTFAAVGIVLAWLWDLNDTLRTAGYEVPGVPSLVAVAATGNATYHWGAPGLAAGFAGAVMIVLVGSLLDQRSRSIDSLAVEGVSALTGSAAVGALVMMRLDSEAAVNAFLVVIALGAAAAWAIERFFPDLQGVDPNLSGAVGALIGALAVGFVVDEFTPAVALVAAAAAIAGMFAGRSLLSLVRSGAVAHTTRSPGMLSSLDGAALAAAGFWLGMRLFG